MYMETARLIIRLPTAADLEAYLSIRNSEFVLKFNAMEKQSVDAAAKELGQNGLEGRVFALEHKQSQKLIGMIYSGEDSLRYGVSSRELSYYLAEEYAHQGYMKEALLSVIPWLREHHCLECISARSFAPNTASQKLLESLGFHRDGYIPRCVKGYGGIVYDDVLYSLQF